MNKGSEMMRSVLAAAERYDSPDAAIHERVWAVVEQRVRDHAPPGLGDADDPGPAIAESSAPAIGSSAAGWLSPLRVLVVLGAVGLGVGAIALGRDLSSGFEDPAVDPVASPPLAALVEGDVTTPAAPAAARLPSRPASPVDAVDDHADPRSRKTAARAEPDATDSLGLEVELLRRARAAANAGRQAEALSILKEHLRRFPAGKLARERDMSRLKAYCALGKQADAKKLAGSMLARDRSDVLRAKLQKTCAGSMP